MEIRTAVPSDAEELIELSQSSILKTCREDYTQPQLKAWANGINRPNRFKEAITTRIIGDYCPIASCTEVVAPRTWCVGASNYVFFVFVVKITVLHKLIP